MSAIFNIVNKVMCNEDMTKTASVKLDADLAMLDLGKIINAQAILESDSEGIREISKIASMTISQLKERVEHLEKVAKISSAVESMIENGVIPDREYYITKTASDLRSKSMIEIELVKTASDNHVKSFDSLSVYEDSTAVKVKGKASIRNSLEQL